MENLKSEKTGVSATKTKYKLRVYIAGPMRGIKDLNRTAFNKAEKKLSKLSYFIPYNPAKQDKELNLTDSELLSKEGLRSVMRRDLNALCECDAVYMLTGWEKSEGSIIEHRLATMLGLTILYE
jgi:hypothetical protein